MCFLFSFFLFFLFSSFRRISNALFTVISLSSPAVSFTESGFWNALKYVSSSSLESTKSYFPAFAAGSRPSFSTTFSALAKHSYFVCPFPPHLEQTVLTTAPSSMGLKRREEAPESPAGARSAIFVFPGSRSVPSDWRTFLMVKLILPSS